MCVNCGGNASPYAVFNVQYQYKSGCTNCGGSQCATVVDSKCVVYTAGNLPNSGILTNDTVEIALQKIDVKLASVIGNYGGFNLDCLAAPGAITTAQEFAEAVSSQFCALKTQVTTFQGTTFPAYQTAVNTRFLALEKPGITCASASVVNTDTLQTVLSKYCTKFGQLDDFLSIGDVNWSLCIPTTPPTNLEGAFGEVLAQICAVKSLVGTGGAALPTFNNIGSVLAAPGAADTLEATVIKLRDRINLLPPFNINTLTWNAIAQPSSANLDLQSAFQAVLSKLDAITQKIPTFNGDFTVTLVDSANPYAGVNVDLATLISTDRFVAVNSSDTAPGTLVDKLVQGTGVVFDTTTTPGKLIINASGGGADVMVKASLGDLTAPDYLDAKMIGGNTVGGALSISTLYDAGVSKVRVQPTLNMGILVQEILTTLDGDNDLLTQLCTLISACVKPCAEPQNPEVVPA